MTVPWVLTEFDLGELTIRDDNPRSGNVRKIEGLIRDNGWQGSIISREVSGRVEVLAGAHRIQAARNVGVGHPIPSFHYPKGTCDARKARRIMLGDNSGSDGSGYDEAKLLALLEHSDGLTGTGFSEKDLAALLRSQAPTPEPDDEGEPPIRVPKKPRTRRGDIWDLGGHRVMCGDCRNPDDVVRLLDGVAVNVAFTSPPYADRRTYDESSGFEPVPPDMYVEWFEPVAANVKAHLAGDGSWFVNIKNGSRDAERAELYVLDLVLAHARKWGWNFATEFCWERIGVPGLPERRFKNQFEPVYQFALGRWKFNPQAVRHASGAVPVAGGPGVGQTSTSEAQGLGSAYFGKARAAGRPASEDVRAPGMAYPGNRLPPFTGSHEALGHGAAFPVGLPEFFIKAYTDETDTVFDPFVGSGSTIIAAHRNNRVGYGMEISPGYVDVTVKRWERETGKKARLA